MRRTEPSDIPDNGQQINQTFLEIGKGRSWHERLGERKDCILIKTLVDSGKLAGRKLSCPFFSGEGAKFREFRTAIQKPELTVPFSRVDLSSNESVRQFIQQFQEDERNVRFSALVSPVEFETDQGRYMRYDMTFFDRPTEKREIEIKQEPTQFQR